MKSLDIKKVHSIVFDFDGVFTDNCVYVDQFGVENVKCNRGDGLGLELLRKFIAINSLNIDIFILSKEKNEVVKQRAAKLKIKCVSAVDNKYDYLVKILKNKFPNESLKKISEGLVYLGNDINDIMVMNLAGFSAAPLDAHQKIKEIASLVINKRGGDQFVRNFIEILINFDNMTMEEISRVM